MKKIITIITLLALSISCLTSCGVRTPISRSEVGDEWNGMIEGEHKVVALISGLNEIADMCPIYDEPEIIDNVISVLKTFEPHIKEEIKDYDSSSAEWLFLYINTGKGDTKKESFAGSNGKRIEAEYNYEICIKFNNDKFLISVIDDISGRNSTVYFKCDVDTAEYQKSLKAIFEEADAE